MQIGGGFCQVCIRGSPSSSVSSSSSSPSLLLLSRIFVARMLSPRLTCLLGILSLLCLQTFAQNNYFITPPSPGPTGQFDDNNVYALGSTINLQWKTNYTTISLALWQNDNNSYALLLDSVPASQTLRWDVDLNDQFNITSASLATPNGEYFRNLSSKSDLDPSVLLPNVGDRGRRQHWRSLLCTLLQHHW